MEQKTISKPTYRMSQVGKCSRALSAIRQGYEAEPEPEWLKIAAEEGKWHEDRIVCELPELDQLLVSDRQKEVRLEYSEFTLVGHIDGITHDMRYKEPFEGMLLEIKSMSQFEFDRWMKQGFKGFPNYADQLTCYLTATRLKEALYIVKNRSSGYVIQTVTTAPSDIDTIVGKLTAVEEWLAKNVENGARDGLYPADFDPNSLECRRCEYKQHCAPEPKELGPATQAELDWATIDWRKGKALATEGQKLIDGAREVLEQHTKATGINKWRFNGLAISLVHYSESKTYPKSNLFQHFTEEQLGPASKIKEAYNQLRIDDLEAE